MTGRWVQKGWEALRRAPVLSPFAMLVALLALFIIIQVARLFWLLVTPIAPIGDWSASIPQTMAADRRKELFAGFDPFFRTVAADQPGQEGDIITALPLTLFGIRSNEASGVGSAFIAGSDGIQQSIAVGQEIMPGVVLHAVAFDHIVLKNNGKLEKLFLDQSVPAQNVTPAAPEPALPPTPEVGAAAPGSVKLNVQNLSSGIGLAPRNAGGAGSKVTGLAVSAKDDGTILKAAGLKAGDVILSVNGAAVGSPSDLASHFQPGARLSVQVERGGQKIPVAIILEKP